MTTVEARRAEWGERLAPFVPSPKAMIDTMLTSARAGPGDVVYDLGSGAGDIVIAAARDFGARAVGIEIDPELVAASSTRVAAGGLGTRARIVHGDFMQTDMRPATIVTIYQLPEVNERLRPLLEAQLRPGTRVVSLDFPVPGWTALRVVTATLPNGSQHAVYLYSVDQPREVKMAQRTGYAVEQFGLELGGVSAGGMKSVEGGGATSEVVTEKIGPDGVVRKHIAGVKYEDITINCGTGMSKAFYGWLSDTLDRRHVRQNGAIVGADYDFNERERLNFYNALVTEIGFPALDASSKDPAFLTVAISPEYTRRVAGQGTRASSSGLKGQKLSPWLRANFRLQIDGLDCTRVTRVDALTVRQTVHEANIGEARDYATAPASLDVPNLVVTVAMSFADSFHDWFDDFVIKGNNDQGSEKNGTLEYLSPNSKDAHFTLSFRNLGICRLTPVPSGQESVRSVRVEMYCEQMALQTGALAVSEPAASAPPPSTAAVSAPATVASLDPLASKLAVARSFATPIAAARAAKIRPVGLRFRT